MCFRPETEEGNPSFTPLAIYKSDNDSNPVEDVGENCAEGRRVVPSEDGIENLGSSIVSLHVLAKKKTQKRKGCFFFASPASHRLCQ